VLEEEALPKRIEIGTCQRPKTSPPGSFAWPRRRSWLRVDVPGSPGMAAPQTKASPRR